MELLAIVRDRLTPQALQAMQFELGRRRGRQDLVLQIMEVERPNLAALIRLELRH